jgi:hypothetical protein
MANFELEADIRRMYADIADYGGDFGDGVDPGGYDPFALASDSGLTPFERAGVAVATLCRLMSAADNTTWGVAVAEYGPRVRRLLVTGAFGHEPLVRAAAESFLLSEGKFVAALRPVYDGVVQRWAAE